MKPSPATRPESCQHTDLAYSEVGQVAICRDCGVVHLSLSYVSLRFDVATFRALTQMLQSAQQKIDDPARACRLTELHEDAAERILH